MMTPRRRQALVLWGALVIVAVGALWPAAPAQGATGRQMTLVSHEPGSPHGPSARVVALTFDDGPNPSWTPQVLRALQRQRVKATFFVLGREARQRPSLVRRIAREGHSIGGHTMDHVDLRYQSAAQFHHQVNDANALTRRISGRAVSCVRPPFGAVNRAVVQRLAARGLNTVLWSVDPRDWSRPGADAIVRQTLQQLRPGAIVVLHDGGGDRSQTVAALPRIIRGARARGYRFVPICR